MYDTVSFVNQEQLTKDMLVSSDWSKADLGSPELDARVDQLFDRLTLGNESP